MQHCDVVGRTKRGSLVASEFALGPPNAEGAE
jgi:hypothetical protein